LIDTKVLPVFVLCCVVVFGISFMTHAKINKLEQMDYVFRFIYLFIEVKQKQVG
jgi:hypothetical protein